MSKLGVVEWSGGTTVGAANATVTMIEGVVGNSGATNATTSNWGVSQFAETLDPVMCCRIA